MKQIKNRVPEKGKLALIDFTPDLKPGKDKEPGDIKEALETCMTIFFEGLGGGR